MTSLPPDLPDWTRAQSEVSQLVTTTAWEGAEATETIAGAPPWATCLMFVMGPVIAGQTPNPLTLTVVGGTTGATYLFREPMASNYSILACPIAPGFESSFKLTTVMSGPSPYTETAIWVFATAYQLTVPEPPSVSEFAQVGNAHGLPTTVQLGAYGASKWVTRAKSLSVVAALTGVSTTAADLDIFYNAGGIQLNAGGILSYTNGLVAWQTDLCGVVLDPGTTVTVEAVAAVDAAEAVLTYQLYQ